MNAAGEIPNQPGVDGAKQRVAVLGVLAQPGHIVEQPTHLGPGEVGGQREAGLRAEAVLAAFLAKFGAELVRACILPHDSIGIRFAGASIPDDGCFTLIRDTHGGDVAGRCVRLGNGTAHYFLRALPYFQRVVLHPAWLWKYLCMLELMHAHRFAAPVEQDATRACGPLVNGGNISRHRTRPLWLMRLIVRLRMVMFMNQHAKRLRRLFRSITAPMWRPGPGGQHCAAPDSWHAPWSPAWVSSSRRLQQRRQRRSAAPRTGPRRRQAPGASASTAGASASTIVFSPRACAAALLDAG